IENIKQAISITNKGIRAMMDNARPGMKEYELEAHFDFVLKSQGVRERAFESIIAGGHNATVLHYVENNSVIEDDTMVLIDLGATYGHYSADISRTFPINGKFTDRQKDVYNLVLRAELETIKAIKPGVPFTTLNEITKRVLTEGAKELGLLSEGQDISDYYYHGVSHFLGLDTHDVGNYRDLTLQPGMVVTIEPGLYIAAEGIGVRIEDDVLVTEEGYEVLSEEILKTVEDIEAYMGRAR
ncbi:MAG TPA: M24B family metallopeptidase, partial [Bacilli bacterium]|nr:M24B family metallopeptidase [Bacilli bacterium]